MELLKDLFILIVSLIIVSNGLWALGFFVGAVGMIFSYLDNLKGVNYE